ncbi:AB hydrolase superfamily protein YdjP [Paraconexibacter sp. AEG42_29]|uniref:AB hydrolase superfamily protein YdjP n=1 Tax=Paraconexibacter sp. AEG42_29 TaxID=2997339 RepID=A0AAU7AZH5_9ACTN
MSRLIAVAADGVRLHVADHGPRDGPPVVLVHGWSLSGAAWGGTPDTLAAAGHRVVALDLRGHGHSDKPAGGYDAGRLAADVTAVLDALDLDDVALVGWSIGGLVAARAALDAPERIGRLVLVAASGAAAARTAGYPFGPPADAVLPHLLAAEGDGPLRPAARRDALANCFAAPPPAALLDRLLDISLRTPTHAAAACLRTLLLTDLSAELPLLRVPVTHIAGATDPSVSLKGVRWAAGVTGSQVVTLDCAHYPMHELPDAFAAALLSACGPTTPAALPDRTPTTLNQGTPA